MLYINVVFGLSLLVASADDAVPDTEPEDHPLTPVLQMAREVLARIENDVKDYTCRLSKRERVRGRLLSYQSMGVKIRHWQVEDGQVITPFGVYVRFFSPDRVKGREVLYVEGRHDGKMIVRNGGERFGFITTSVAPDSRAAMQEGRYPITEIGVKNLVRRLIEVGEEQLKCQECEVKILEGAKINDRPCTVIQVSHTIRREHHTFQMARIFVDAGLQLPVRYTAHDWPEEEGGEPLLLEEYTYTDIRINAGLTDRDFDHRNETYDFLKSFEP